MILTRRACRRLSYGVCWHAKGNPKHICVSVINKRLSSPQRQTINYPAQQASSTDQRVLRALHCMKSLISGGASRASRAVFLSAPPPLTAARWTRRCCSWQKEIEGECASLPSIYSGLDANCAVPRLTRTGKPKDGHH